MSVKAKKKRAKTPIRRVNGAPKKTVPQESAWDEMQRILKNFEALPKDAWRNTPRDLAKNLDHYLYGHSKEEL